MITYKQLGNYGRFGNQLFQIASTIGIAMENGQDFGFPDWRFQNFFKNKLPKVKDNLFCRTYNEEGFKYRDIVLSGDTDWNLVGYFQSWKYFRNCGDTVGYHFYFDRIMRDGVAVHVRRGDYVQLQNFNTLSPISYFENALTYFPNEHITVFSDDIEWCKQNFKQSDIEFINSGSDIDDFKLMASYEKFIISSSTFSWWAAWLSGRQVIAPNKWFAETGPQDYEDIYMPDWIRL